MEDPETKTSLVDTTTEQSLPITVFKLKCRIRYDTLHLRELPLICFLLLTILSLCGTSVIFMRESIPFHGLNLRWFSLFTLFACTIMYGLLFINIYNGGWGAADTRFWCDVKIMYVRGFNSIRTIMNWLTTSLVFIQLAILFNVESSLLFIAMLVIISEWQAGISENQNQYDIKFTEKFTDIDQHLLVEFLHAYQLQHPLQKIDWVCFIIHSTLKIYILSVMFYISPGLRTEMAFTIPFVVCSIVWKLILPCVLDFAYFKQVITFCQLEIYRMITDVVMLLFLTMFALV